MHKSWWQQVPHNNRHPKRLLDKHFTKVLKEIIDKIVK